MLTERHGVVKAVARGARRPGSRFAGRLEPFVLARVMLRPGRELDAVSQAETVDARASLRGDYVRFLMGEAMLELAWRSLHEGQQSSRLFQALDASLRCLEGDAVRPDLLLAAFELKICGLLGYRPSFQRCSRCGISLRGKAASFSPEGGGVVCGSCRPAGAAGRTLRAETLALAEAAVSTPLKGLAGLRVTEEQSASLLRLAIEYVEYHLDRRLRSHAAVLQHLGGGGDGGQARPLRPGGPDKSFPL
jgi:DNA repair protein RecO (recombination protein O)